jgi:Fic-DOC domain mobile mystery protein B
MSDPLLDIDDAATPLTADERADLIPAYISLRSELNSAEQANILEAELWAFRRKRNILDERFLTGLHKRMFGNVWKWAGSFRKTERNIGVLPYRIAADLAQLLDDAEFWRANNSYDPDELAARFHHRLVWIHPFPNGNGRHARLAADLLLVSLGRPRFTWGRGNLVNASATRRQYVDALRAADQHDIDPLKNFVRS